MSDYFTVCAVALLPAPNSLAPTLSVLASLSVGCVLLLAGLLKLLSPSAFIRHLSILNANLMAALPQVALRWIAGLLATAECVLGVAVVVRIYPDWLFPFCLGVLAVFGMVTIWSASVGRIDDCGCYGNLLALTPVQSVLLTALYAALIVVAWRFPVVYAFMSAAQTDVLIGSIAFFVGIGVVSLWSHGKFGQDLVNTSPVRPRRRWNPSWLEGFTYHANQRAQLIVLLHPDCPACHKWIQPLNKVSRRADTPQVIAGIAAEAGTIRNFLNEFHVEFPVLPVKAVTMARLALAYPTLVVVQDGRIVTVNVGQLPPELIDQLRHYNSNGTEHAPAAAMAGPDQSRYRARA